MRILVLSDLEDRDLNLDEIPIEAIDVIVSCGDVYRRTYDQIEAIHLPTLAVHGNHDDPDWPDFVTDLHMNVVEFGGLRFAGFEGCRRYKPGGRFQYAEAEVERFLNWFPSVDVFVAHSPMAGLFEVDDGIHNGFQAFRDYVERTSPALFLHGHSNEPGEDLLQGTRIVSVHGWTTIDLDSPATPSSAPPEASIP